MDVRIGVDAEEWTAALHALAVERPDQYFTPEFHDVHAAHGDGTPHASIVRQGPAVLLVPGLRRVIDGGAGQWDLQTCRTGCAGPLASAGVDASFLERAWAAWTSEMVAQGAVAAFFRLHPMIANERWLPASADVRVDRSAVVIDLNSGKDHAWASAASRHRNMVRKAQRLQCEVSWNDGHVAFERLYADAMRRLDSDADLRFDQRFFNALWMLSDVELAVVRAEGEIVAGAVFVWAETWGHYFLAARCADAGNHVSNLLLDAAADRAVVRGVSSLYLGGGRTTRPDDPLLQFKRAAGTRLVDYRVALVPINDHARQQLVDVWTAQTGRAPTWLLGYRQPIPAHVVSDDN
jgi:GNAT acetyltransferase-like protein